MRVIRLFLIIVSCCVTSCVEPIDIEIEGASELIVIDAMVTDLDTVQIVYVRREQEILIDYFNGKDENPPIADVTVHIEDDNGWSAYFDDVNGCGREFHLEGHQFEPGRSYTLTVRVGSRVFRATETMVKSPDVIGLKFSAHHAKEDVESWYPVLYFKDNQPDVDNYYMFSHNYEYIRNHSQFEEVYIHRISDIGLNPDFDGILMSLGLGEKPDKAIGWSSGRYVVFYLYTISKSNYDYIGLLEENITNDGGVYKPMPSSPATNFSGDNVQGQFIAASKTEMRELIGDDNTIIR